MGKWVHDLLRDRLLARAGLLVDTRPKLTLQQLEDEVRRNIWDEQFLRYMFNRLLMGRLRYGPRKAKSGYNYVKAIEDKIAKYKETGNTEMLVDIGNYAMIEFGHGEHPNKHFAAEDDVTHCPKR